MAFCQGVHGPFLAASCLEVAYQEAYPGLGGPYLGDAFQGEDLSSAFLVEDLQKTGQTYQNKPSVKS